MSEGYPQRTKSAHLGELGVSLVSRVVHEEFGWLFRRNHQENDFGIDAYIEVVTSNGSVTGQMLAVQIKCGASYFAETNRWGFVYQTKHFNYLANCPIPVLLILCHPETNECYWVKFAPEET